MSYTYHTLSNCLRNSTFEETTWFTKIKILYRPLICPFGDLLSLIPKGSSLIDIGCGDGAFLSLISQLRSPKKLGGIDICPNQITNVKKLLASLEVPFFLNDYDGYNLPEDIANYDIVSLIDVLHHIPQERQKKFLSQLVDLMSPGSTIIIKDICRSSFPLFLFNKLHDLIVSRQIGYERSRFVVKDWLINMNLDIISANFKIVFWYPHYWIVAKKT